MPRLLPGRPRVGLTGPAGVAAGVTALLVASPLAHAAPSPTPAAGATVTATSAYTCHARDVTMKGTLTVSYVQPGAVAPGESATFALPHGTWTVAAGSIPVKYQAAAMFVTPRLEANGQPGPFVDALISGPQPAVAGGFALTRPIAITPLTSDEPTVTLALPEKMTVQATLSSGKTPNNRSFTCTTKTKDRTLSTVAFEGTTPSATPSESPSESPSETPSGSPSETATPSPTPSPTVAPAAPATPAPTSPLADTGADAAVLPFLLAGGLAAVGGATALTLSRKGRR